MGATLVILAAGMASRYGKGAKQTESFGPSGETIMEYSIYDAIEAGFDKVVFIIREDFADSFKAKMEPLLQGKVETVYVFQSLGKFLGNHELPKDRTKPFGTGHAILCCKGAVNEPFAVINADDYYGKDAFVKAKDLLSGKVKDNTYACVGYELGNTLSDNGSVTRGEIFVNEKGEIQQIIERKKIVKEAGKAISTEDGHKELPLDTKVSMNFFCFDGGYIDKLEILYQDFLDKNLDDLKSEFLIPEVTDILIKNGDVRVLMVPTTAKWFGVTYEQDAPLVRAKFKELTENGEYPSSLWEKAKG
ncbi:MAG: sugar phosphate nucleotidyltransferase [Chitinophagaceae bacterium]